MLKFFDHCHNEVEAKKDDDAAAIKETYDALDPAKFSTVSAAVVGGCVLLVRSENLMEMLFMTMRSLKIKMVTDGCG